MSRTLQRVVCRVLFALTPAKQSLRRWELNNVWIDTQRRPSLPPVSKEKRCEDDFIHNHV